MTTRSLSRSTFSSNGRTSRLRTTAGSDGRTPAPRILRTPARTNGRVRLLPSFHSEPKREALLQSGTSPRSDRLLVRYADGAVHLALSGRGAPLLDGHWQMAVSVDGCDLAGRGDWEAVCWNADEDGDYLELQLPLEGGARIDRQLLLPRDGHLAFFADSILAPRADRITYRARWPMAAGLRHQTETKNRAVRVRGAQTAARIFPLALPAERVRSTADQLACDAAALELIQHGRGSALYAPLVVDWSPKRRRLPVFWRGLTVSERSRTLSADVAVGYRLQVGTAQWLVYHSLQNSGEARAVLGHHTWNETVIGAFRRNGTVDPLILIE